MEEMEERQSPEERRQRRQRGEKDEKQHEKDEKNTRDPLSGLFWGLILVMVGVIYFSRNAGLLPEATWWAYIVLGLGIVFLLEAVVRWAMPEHRYGAWGRVIPGVILLLVGLWFIYGAAIGTWWPIILIAIGAILVLGAVFRGGRR